LVSLEVSFTSNADRGCSEFYCDGFRVAACLFHQPDAVCLEIEQECDGAWHTVYWEKVPLDGFPRGAARDRIVNENLVRVTQRLLARIMKSRRGVDEPAFLPRPSSLLPLRTADNLSVVEARLRLE
jgi:hypothetical protein